jgi:hypothetical protein
MKWIDFTRSGAAVKSLFPLCCCDHSYRHRQCAAVVITAAKWKATDIGPC